MLAFLGELAAGLCLLRPQGSGILRTCPVRGVKPDSAVQARTSRIMRFRQPHDPDGRPCLPTLHPRSQPPWPISPTPTRSNSTAPRTSWWRAPCCTRCEPGWSQPDRRWPATGSGHQGAGGDRAAAALVRRGPGPPARLLRGARPSALRRRAAARRGGAARRAVRPARQPDPGPEGPRPPARLGGARRHGNVAAGTRRRDRPTRRAQPRKRSTTTRSRYRPPSSCSPPDSTRPQAARSSRTPRSPPVGGVAPGGVNLPGATPASPHPGSRRDEVFALERVEPVTRRT
jgi:hypothetical protein